MSTGWGPYLRQEEAKRNLCEGLRRAGATIFGWHPDRSDSMSDYWQPASWDGIATYEDYTIVVAISPLDLPQSGSDGWPAFQLVQKGFTWHIEKDGEVVARGKGLNLCTGWGVRKLARSMSHEDELVAKASDALASKILGIIDRLNGKGREPMLSQPKPKISGMEPSLSQPKETPFEAAKRAYPNAVRVGNSWWQLVDGELVSGIEQHRGKLILQEDREGCSQEFNHWGSYIMASEMESRG